MPGILLFIPLIQKQVLYMNLLMFLKQRLIHFLFEAISAVEEKLNRLSFHKTDLSDRIQLARYRK